MSWMLLQDAIATTLAAGAAVVIARRIFDVVRPSERQAPCGSCGSCPPAKAAPPAASVVPLATLRRRSRTAD